MKKTLYLLLLFNSLFIYAQVSWQSGSNPEANQSATILFNKTGTGLAAYTGTIYAHTGVTLNGNAWQNVIGTWGNNTLQPTLTLVSGSVYKLELTPNILAYYNNPVGTISKINIVFRSADGSQQTTNLELPIGSFQATLNTPTVGSVSLLNSGSNLAITASNTGGSANYNLFVNGIPTNSASGSTYSFSHQNITQNSNYELIISQGTASFSKKFSVVVVPTIINQAVPSGLENGINYNTSDNTKATLVLEAPGKDFVYVAGSFNNWNPNNSYSMKKDTSNGKFWLELTGLTAGVDYSYQYWVVDQTPIANSPTLVKTADPCSTTVLSYYDDPWIPSTSYPGLPAFPAASAQEREVTLLKTGQTPYNWVSTSFTKPNKDKLVVYELLVRDFDGDRNFQDIIDRIQYFKDLGINAIELMPIMEFEGNESWGYNTAFHMALDKFYGTPEKLKELVDVCHQNGIAVILDIAFNHAFGRNPMIRMWMNDPDGDGWGGPSTENPYFNTTVRHSYADGIGEDFNHSSVFTKNYVKQTIKHWITEFKIDGFRWDLTKGFTQACTSGDNACTDMLQPDRVAVLKEYADYSWSLDNDHYVIFEHLGSDDEEQEWANYRIGEGKGVMMWGEMYTQYKELAMGYATQNISRMSHFNHGFTGKRLIGYPESHDKDRMMYEAITYGNGAGAYPVNGNLTNALNRMGSIGATSILIPGPKMIWHFGELGSNQSIWTCSNGTINSDNDATPGDCKLDTKAQIQWGGNWLADTRRTSILNDWSKMIKLKTSEPVFMADHSISPDGSNLKQRVYIYSNSFPTTQLRNVVVIANFSTDNLSINPSFPTDVYTYPMTWYDLMDNNAPVVISSPTAAMTVNSGRFRVFGNQPATTLSDSEFDLTSDEFFIYPNPTKNSFSLSKDASSIEIYTITGQLVNSFKNIQMDQQLNIESLQTGIYSVKIIDNNGISQTKKLIKE